MIVVGSRQGFFAARDFFGGMRPEVSMGPSHARAHKLGGLFPKKKMVDGSCGFFFAPAQKFQRKETDEIIIEARSHSGLPTFSGVQSEESGVGRWGGEDRGSLRAQSRKPPCGISGLSARAMRRASLDLSVDRMSPSASAAWVQRSNTPKWTIRRRPAVGFPLAPTTLGQWHAPPIIERLRNLFAGLGARPCTNRPGP